MNELEEIAKLLNSQNLSKKIIKEHLKKLEHLINKILTGHLTQTEQNALVKHVTKAQEVLRHLT